MLRVWQVPIGELKVGLARHRALLFKFLADSSNLKSRILRGSYTGRRPAVWGGVGQDPDVTDQSSACRVLVCLDPDEFAQLRPVLAAAGVRKKACYGALRVLHAQHPVRAEVPIAVCAPA